MEDQTIRQEPVEDIAQFLDEQGRVKTWPARHAKKLAVLGHLAEAFEDGREYTEREVNEIIERRHTFGDYFLLRRELIDVGCLKRTADGRTYWKA